MHDDYKNAYLDAAFGDGHTADFPATVYAALFLTDGTTEVAGGSYARVAVTNNSTNFPDAASGMQDNGTAVTFPTASANWGLVQYIKWMDAAAAGKEIHKGELGTPTAITTGMTANFPAGTLVIQALGS